MYWLALPALGLAALVPPAASGAASPSSRVATLSVDALAALRERVVRGEVTARCAAAGTTLHFDLAGLVPGGTYTLWVFVFDGRGPVTPADALGAGAVGAGDGGGHQFSADARGRALLTVRQPGGPLSAFGRVRGCLLDEAHWRIIGAYHPRRITAGTRRPDTGEAVEHFGVRGGR